MLPTSFLVLRVLGHCASDVLSGVTCVRSLLPTSFLVLRVLGHCASDVLSGVMCVLRMFLRHSFLSDTCCMPWGILATYLCMRHAVGCFGRVSVYGALYVVPLCCSPRFPAFVKQC